MIAVHHADDTPLPLWYTCTTYGTEYWYSRVQHISLIRNSLPGGNRIKSPAAVSTVALIAYPRLGVTFRGIAFRHASIAGEVRSSDACYQIHT
jgi:hypothetical protein